MHPSHPHILLPSQAVHEHAGRYDCQGTPSPISALRALASITLADTCAALSRLPFIEVTVEDIPFLLGVVLKVFSWVFTAGIWILIGVLSLFWPPQDIPPPSHRYVHIYPSET